MKFGIFSVWCGVALAGILQAAPSNTLSQPPLKPLTTVPARPPLLPVLPQNDVLPATLEEVARHREDMTSALVIVDTGLKDENARWQMGQVQLQVFMAKLLETVRQRPTGEDFIWPQLPRVNESYHGIRVLFQTEDGQRFAPFTIFEGKVMAPNNAMVTRDYGRQLEYFIFGTARVRRDQMLGVNYLPVFTFEQCRLMGQKILDTEPRQCLLPDNNIMLETSEKPTLVSARMKTFNDCLLNGKALIYTFPRRCMAAGGRVLTEPPQVYEAARAAEAAKEAARARRASIVQAQPKNTAVGATPLGQEVASPTESVPSQTTVVTMPTPRGLSVTVPPASLFVSPTAPRVSSTHVPVKDAIAAAQSVLHPKPLVLAPQPAAVSPAGPVSFTVPRMTLGR